MNSKADILIVDDEANTLASLSRAFRLAGHEVTVCDNAVRALELAKSHTFDLILSDVVMPKRDGIALLQDLKTNGVAAPVVMMSGQAHIEMAVQATRIGALDFLEKPLTIEKVTVVLNNAVQQRRLELGLLIHVANAFRHSHPHMARMEVPQIAELAQSSKPKALEAMARSVPVACSDIPALREVAGEAALYFDPRAPAQIAARIAQLLADTGLAERLRELGRARAAGFSWSAAAEGTLASYRRALQ